MLNTSPTTLAVQTGATAKMVARFQRGRVNAKRLFEGRSDKAVRQTTDKISWRSRKVRGRADVVKTHLFLVEDQHANHR